MVDQRIDINRADQETLAALPGIGSVLAARIVEFREQVHPFADINELTEVPGVSRRMVDEIAERLTVEPDADMTGSGEAETPSTVPTDTEAEGEMAVEDGDAPPAPADPPLDDEIILSVAEKQPEQTEAATAQEAPSTDEQPDPEPEPASPPGETAVMVPGRPSVWGYVAAAVAGALITLLLLFLINGTLRYADNPQVQSLGVQLTAEADVRAGAQEALREVEAQAATLEAGAVTAEADTEAVRREIGRARATLAAQTQALEERIDRVALAAEDFEAFLLGMRDLLFELQGPPPTPTATMSATATTTATATARGTRSATVTAVPATRTPRPTATPLVRPTPTAP